MMNDYDTELCRLSDTLSLEMVCSAEDALACQYQPRLNITENRSILKYAVAKWINLPGSAINQLQSYILQSASLRMETLVIFRYGTMVHVVDRDPEFQGFSPENHQQPEYRMSKFVAGLIDKRNVLTWDVQKNITGEAGVAIRQAYLKLMREGYIYPGTSPSEECGALPMNTLGLWQMFRPYFAGSITNIMLATSYDNAMRIGNDYRRYDYIAPEVVVVVSRGIIVYSS